MLRWGMPQKRGGWGVRKRGWMEKTNGGKTGLRAHLVTTCFNQTTPWFTDLWFNCSIPDAGRELRFEKCFAFTIKLRSKVSRVLRPWGSQVVFQFWAYKYKTNQKQHALWGAEEDRVWGHLETNFEMCINVKTSEGLTDYGYITQKK